MATEGKKNPRVLIAMLGMDQHEVGALTVAKILRDAGMEVIYNGRFNLPVQIVNSAVEEDVDVIGLSCHSWEYLYFVPEILALLSEHRLTTPLVIGGSVVTREDQQKMLQLGVSAAFGSSSTPREIVDTLQRLAADGEAEG
ncbi:MAG: cobalamin-dependent protein [bacterium]